MVFRMTNFWHLFPAICLSCDVIMRCFWLCVARVLYLKFTFFPANGLPNRQPRVGPPERRPQSKGNRKISTRMIRTSTLWIADPVLYYCNWACLDNTLARHKTLQSHSRYSISPGIAGKAQFSTFFGNTLITFSAVQDPSCIKTDKHLINHHNPKRNKK